MGTMKSYYNMAQLGLEESSEVEGFRRPKQAQIEAELCVSDLSGSFFGRKSDVVMGNTSIFKQYSCCNHGLHALVTSIFIPVAYLMRVRGEKMSNL